MRRLLIWLIRLYQKYISAFTPPSCKYCPTCSSYGVQAVSRFGAVKGTFLTVWRILRCNPFSAGGYDPVPDRFKRIDYKKIKSEKVEFGE